MFNQVIMKEYVGYNTSYICYSNLAHSNNVVVNTSILKGCRSMIISSNSITITDILI